MIYAQTIAVGGMTKWQASGGLRSARPQIADSIASCSIQYTFTHHDDSLIPCLIVTTGSIIVHRGVTPASDDSWTRPYLEGSQTFLANDMEISPKAQGVVTEELCEMLDVVTAEPTDVN